MDYSQFFYSDQVLRIFEIVSAVVYKYSHGLFKLAVYKILGLYCVLIKYSKGKRSRNIKFEDVKKVSKLLYVLCP